MLNWLQQFPGMLQDNRRCLIILIIICFFFSLYELLADLQIPQTPMSMSSVPKAIYQVSTDVREFLPKFRQQYRALLREATYLPDEAARKFVHDTIVKRFNPHHPQKLDQRYWGTDYFRSKFDLEKVKKRSKKIATKLHQLERINREGSSEDIQHVLMRTYGRAGHRRRALLSALLRPGEDELPQDDTALSNIIDSQIAAQLDATRDIDIARAPDVSKRQRRGHKQLLMFLATQQKHNPMESLRGKIRSLAPKLPERNAWGRKLAEKRKENMKREWWANLLERVLPPLPEYEFDRLEALAKGEQPTEDLRPRRKEATSSNSDQLNDDIERMKRFMVPARVNINHWEKEMNNREGDDSLPRSLRVRTMRRIYGMIWSNSAKMVQDENTKEYIITWGGERSPAATGEMTKPTSKDAEFFSMLGEGVNTDVKDKRIKKFISRQQKKIAR